MFDKNTYYTYSKTLETFSMIKFAIFMIIYIVGGYLVGEYLIKNTFIGILIGIVIGITLQYLNYLKEQIKVEEMRMLLEIHNSITNKKN